MGWREEGGIGSTVAGQGEGQVSEIVFTENYATFFANNFKFAFCFLSYY